MFVTITFWLLPQSVVFTVFVTITFWLLPRVTGKEKRLELIVKWDCYWQDHFWHMRQREEMERAQFILKNLMLKYRLKKSILCLVLVMSREDSFYNRLGRDCRFIQVVPVSHTVTVLWKKLCLFVCLAKFSFKGVRVVSWKLHYNVVCDGPWSVICMIYWARPPVHDRNWRRM